MNDKNLGPRTIFNRPGAKLLWRCLFAALIVLMGSGVGASDSGDLGASTITLDPPVTHFFAGQAVSPVLLVKDLPEATAPRQLLWRLLALDATLAEGAFDLPLAAGDAQAMITFTLPDLQRRTVMHLIARVSSGPIRRWSSIPASVLYRPPPSKANGSACLPQMAGRTAVC